MGNIKCFFGKHNYELKKYTESKLPNTETLVYVLLKWQCTQCKRVKYTKHPDFLIEGRELTAYLLMKGGAECN